MHTASTRWLALALALILLLSWMPCGVLAQEMTEPVGNLTQLISGRYLLQSSDGTFPGCLEEGVFCFYTNVLMIPFVLYRHRHMFFKRESARYFDKALRKPVLTASAAVLLGYIATLLSMYLVGKVDLLFASAFGPPLTICFNFLFDTLYFREPIKRDKIISMILAIGAIIFLV